MALISRQMRFPAGSLTFLVHHELWDGNIDDHADQGVAILVSALVDGTETTVLRFNCFDIEKSYVYGPENATLQHAGPAMLGEQARASHGPGQLYRMDPIADGNPIGWSVRTMASKLPKMLVTAGYPALAGTLDLAAIVHTLPEVEACARELYAAKRNTVKHNRGTHVYDLGAIKIGLEMRRLPVGDGGLAIHVLADLAGSTENSYVEETEILAFDCFWDGPHYHYGPRNKNHRIYWDRTLVENPLVWVFEQFEHHKLGAMIERAGYPGVAADLDQAKVAALLPTIKQQAWKMWEEGEALTGHPGLPLEVTPNLVTR